MLFLVIIDDSLKCIFRIFQKIINTRVMAEYAEVKVFFRSCFKI